MFNRHGRLTTLLMAAAVNWPWAAAATPRTFEALEAKLSDALAAYDRAELDRLWDDDLVFVFPDGHLSRKAERLKAQVPPPDTGGPKLSAKNEAVDLEFEDAHTAVVVVRSSWRFAAAAPQLFVATHVWIHRPNGWRLLSAQVAEEPGKP
jgi:ketosteroid isomerase-like protein